MIDKTIQSIGGRIALELAIQNNLKWLNKSFSHNKDFGSSAYCNVLGMWSGPYPETTGYLLPTLVKARKILNDTYWIDLAGKQLLYFERIQNNDGSFKRENGKKALVFDTSQILLGLCVLSKENIFVTEKPSIEKAYLWILSRINDEGEFTDNNFVKDYNPSYYSRIIWALLEAEKIIGIKTDLKTIKLYDNIKSLQNPNGTFDKFAFSPDEPGYTHTLIYTIRGLWESAKLLQDSQGITKMESTVNVLDDLINRKGKLAGSYNDNWNGDYSFVCSVGNCQLALLKVLMKKRDGSADALKNIDLLLKPVLKSQRMAGLNKGAIPSSIPIYGKYQRFKYTNWTQKFFLDSILELLDYSK